MRLSRTDLADVFIDRLFEIETKKLSNHETKFKDEFIRCILSSKPTEFGYQISGTFNVKVEYSCDRCTVAFENIVDDTIKIWCITSSIQTLNNKTEIVFMKKSNDFIDFIPILSDLIILNKPMKVLCRNNCKGICLFCGTNLNDNSCFHE